MTLRADGDGEVYGGDQLRGSFDRYRSPIRRKSHMRIELLKEGPPREAREDLVTEMFYRARELAAAASNSRLPKVGEQRKRD